MAKGVSIEALTSTVSDNGRRGEPRAGCDCVQCFGYCIVNEEQALRDRALKYDGRESEKPLLDAVT